LSSRCCAVASYHLRCVVALSRRHVAASSARHSLVVVSSYHHRIVASSSCRRVVVVSLSSVSRCRRCLVIVLASSLSRFVVVSSSRHCSSSRRRCAVAPSRRVGQVRWPGTRIELAGICPPPSPWCISSVAQKQVGTADSHRGQTYRTIALRTDLVNTVADGRTQE
jgi:hypothetical protein